MNRFHWFLAMITILSACTLPPAPCRAQGTDGPQKAGWRLTFDDEFSGPMLDTRKWTASEGTFENRSEPVQYFLPESVTVGQGHLRLTSEQKPSHGHGYTSGEIRTLDKFCQLYGRLEVRCRFPTAPGTWSAVYLLPADDSWPPEIDAAEFIGRTSEKVYLTNHWRGDAGQHQQVNCDWTDPAVDWGAWHTYAVEWQPRSVRWYIDGVLRGTDQGPTSAVPMYIRINTSVGGGFAGEPQPGAWPQTFELDYVRMYRRQGQPVPHFRPLPHVVPPHFTPVAQIASPPPPPSYSAPPPEPASQDDQEGPSLWGVFFLLGTPLLVWWWMGGRIGARGARTAALAAGVWVSAGGYLLFRVQVINWAAWWVALPLFLAEMHGLTHGLGLQYTLWPRPSPVLFAEEDPSTRPVFVLIPTVNEGPDVLGLTVEGALRSRTHYLTLFPDAEVTVVVCNDGSVAGYPDWYAAEKLAERMGVVCVTRPVGGGAKAGNIEWARQTVGAVGDALIVLFDADQIAEEEFLARAIAPFTDPSIGWVQTGQYYRNLENPVARWANDQQSLFYQVLCPGKAALNAAFICGTNVVVRADALDEIGGLPQDSVTEDFAASLLLHPRWRSVFLPEVLARGLGPMDLPSYFAQQGRWATGTLGVLRRHWRMLLLPKRDGLSLPQRVQYGLACTHYLSGLRDLVYLLVPFLFLLMGVSALRGADMPTFLGRFLPYFFFSQLAFWHAARRKTTWRGIVLSFGSFPVLLASLLLVVLGQKTRFAITPKHRSRVQGKVPQTPQLLAGALCLVGLVLAAASPEDKTLVLLSAFWLFVMLLMLSGVLWLGVQDRRTSLADHSDAALPVHVPPSGGDTRLDDGRGS